ncbi:GNAT family N-acetyltransferase [Alkalicoccobacillus murimartini]|uniref:N-acetylglutamate synthase-like GNAT family acetyltransferase n=1 Tax=Alkalicoccobacillus murimartini TaxID=171685 RepID=A0ABT9YGR4_9BACI|nr:hypothetical protein [Alkalicoccobacillus murimartini]MDQ0207052.1 N-acetylglutamate synthase-like GNAT family acetyltransferase [Alkalicoccobacillus murimartini]
MTMVFRQAQDRDLLYVQRLLARAGLREDDTSNITNIFLVAETIDNEIVGIIGLEPSGDYGLLRSLVLETDYFTPAKGMGFLEAALAYGRKLQLNEVFLITKQAGAFFEQLQFRPIKQIDVPNEIQRLSHFQQFENQDVTIFACELLEQTCE